MSPQPIADISGDKTQLRKALRATRRGLGTDEQKAAGENLLLQLQGLTAFSQSNRIALYIANDGEIDPACVVRWCHEQQRKSFVPVVRQQQGRNSLLFAEITPDTEFADNKFGIPEPVSDSSQLIEAAELDLVLLPLVGFDQQGNRIGMGGGFYDTTFEFLKDSVVRKPQLVGVAHECQRVEHINAESWDVALTTVVTDQNTYHLSR